MHLKKKEAYKERSRFHDDWQNTFADMELDLYGLGLEEEVIDELDKAIEELKDLTTVDNIVLQEPIDADGDGTLEAPKLALEQEVDQLNRRLVNQEDSKVCTGDDRSIHFDSPTDLSEHPERPAGPRPRPPVMSQAVSEQSGRYDMHYHAIDYERFRKEESTRKGAALADAQERVHKADLDIPLNGHSLGSLLDILPLKKECAEVNPIPTLQSWQLSSDYTTLTGRAFCNFHASGSPQNDNGFVSFSLAP